MIRIDRDFEELVPALLEDIKKDIVEMGQLLAAQGFEEIAAKAHSIKGAGGGYGFDSITGLAACIEDAAKAKDAVRIRTGLDDLSEYVENVEVVYE